MRYSIHSYRGRIFLWPLSIASDPSAVGGNRGSAGRLIARSRAPTALVGDAEDLVVLDDDRVGITLAGGSIGEGVAHFSQLIDSGGVVREECRFGRDLVGKPLLGESRGIHAVA